MKKILENFKNYSDKQLILFTVIFGIIGLVCVVTTFFKSEYFSIGIGLGVILIIIAIWYLIILAIRNKTSNKNPELIPKQDENQKNLKNIHNNKLIYCKTCGKEIAKTAQNCPHCGARRGLSITDQSCLGVVVANIIIAVLVLLSICYVINTFSTNQKNSGSHNYIKTEQKSVSHPHHTRQ